MAEDVSLGSREIPGLSSDDIIPRVYEGGFKTWECAIDLARYLGANTHHIDCDSSDSLALIEVSGRKIYFIAKM